MMVDPADVERLFQCAERLFVSEGLYNPLDEPPRLPSGGPFLLPDEEAWLERNGAE